MSRRVCGNLLKDLRENLSLNGFQRLLWSFDQSPLSLDRPAVWRCRFRVRGSLSNPTINVVRPLFVLRSSIGCAAVNQPSQLTDLDPQPIGQLLWRVKDRQSVARQQPVIAIQTLIEKAAAIGSES